MDDYCHGRLYDFERSRSLNLRHRDLLSPKRVLEIPTSDIGVLGRAYTSIAASVIVLTSTVQLYFDMISEKRRLPFQINLTSIPFLKRISTTVTIFQYL